MEQQLFPARESLVSDIPAGDGKIINLFLQCIFWSIYGGGVRRFDGWFSKVGWGMGWEVQRLSQSEDL
jgi:hypothetical protein